MTTRPEGSGGSLVPSATSSFPIAHQQVCRSADSSDGFLQQRDLNHQETDVTSSRETNQEQQEVGSAAVRLRRSVDAGLTKETGVSEVNRTHRLKQ